MKTSHIIAAAIASTGLYFLTRKAKAAAPAQVPEFTPSPASIPAPPAPAQTPTSAPTHASVQLISVGASKVNVIKAVQGVLGIGLKAAKEKVESAPSFIAEGMPIADANKLVAALTQAGAQAQLA